MTTTDTPRAWVGCLACYNAGNLVGSWVDGIEAAEDSSRPHVRLHDSMKYDRPATAATQAALDRGHEETWCFDLEGYGSFLSSECSPTEAQAVAEDLAETESRISNLDAFDAYIGPRGLAPNEGLLDAVPDFEDAFCGQWESERDYAMELADAMGVEPKEYVWPTSCIDWEQATRELFMDYSSAPAPSGGVYVFREV